MNITSDTITKEVKNILQESSFLFYEFKDITKEIVFNDINSTNTVVYSKKQSPLFTQDVVDDVNYSSLLDIILSKIPFYSIESSTINTSFVDNLRSIVRDPGKVDVPSTLQTPFWQEYFIHSQGYFHNELLLSIYNKLRYPFVSENQYLNADLFPELSLKHFRDTTENTVHQNYPIDFNHTTDDNISNEYEIGYLDFLNSTIDEKLLSTYTLLDYKPEQDNLLKSWSDSLYWSGKVGSSDIEREKTIYRLQDLKYELLRRKFAGSSTLYSLSLKALNRSGSFISAAKLSDFNTGEYSEFKDDRLARLLHIPGLITTRADLSEYDIIKTFYENPIKNNSSNYIDLGVITPLYYTSATIEDPSSNSTQSYNGKKFYLFDSAGNASYRSKFLRDTGAVINWDNPESSWTAKLAGVNYPKLDEYEEDPNITNFKIYNKLDTEYFDKTTNTHYDVIKLDIQRSNVSSTAILSNVFDISVDSILYHSNSQQQSLAESYMYPTYSIANNQSLSMMDTSWINYLQNSTASKSRVQDIIKFGLQLSHYQAVSQSYFESTYSFFAIGYSTVSKASESSSGVSDIYDTLTGFEEAKFTVPSSLNILEESDANPKPSYSNLSHRYAYLYRFTIRYDVKLLQVKSIDRSCISRITLNIPKVFSKKPVLQENQYYELPKYWVAEALENSDIIKIDEVAELLTHNVGILPFTYPEVVARDKDYYNSTVSVFDIKYSLQRQISGSESTISFIDDITDLNYSKAYYVFCNSDILDSVPSPITTDTAETPNFIEYLENNKENAENAEGSYTSPFKGYFTLEPTEHTKAVYYIVKRRSIEDTSVKYTYYFSEPISFVELTSSNKALLEGLLDLEIEDSVTKEISYPYFIPDWYSLGYYLNPYLNFTKDSASPLRYKDVFKAPLSSKEILKGRSYRKDILLTDSGTEIEKMVDGPGGPSTDAALSNLSRIRGYDYLCNDNGQREEKSPWVDSINEDVHGTYLYNYYPSTNLDVQEDNAFENVAIYGDNRYTSDITYINDRNKIFRDTFSSSNTNLSNSKESRDSLESSTLKSGNYCLNFRYPKYSRYGENIIEGSSYSNINSMFLMSYKPSNPDAYPLNEDYDEKWWWNRPLSSNDLLISLEGISLKDGIDTYQGKSIFINFRPDFTEVAEEHLNEEEELPSEPISAKMTLFEEHVKSSDFSSYAGDTRLGIYLEYTRQFTSSTGELKTLSPRNKGEVTSKGYNTVTEVTPVLKLIKTREGSSSTDIYTIQAKTITINNIDTCPSLRIGVSVKDNSNQVSFIVNNNLYSTVLHNSNGALEKLEENNIPNWHIDTRVNAIEIAGNTVNISKNGVDSLDQQNIAYGYLYDLRLYRCFIYPELMILLNRGTTRELYSHAPSIHKLGYHVYEDLGIFKKTTIPSQSTLPEVSKVRIFNRSTWDTILVDNYPISALELNQLGNNFNSSLNINKYYQDPDIFLKIVEYTKDGEGVERENLTRFILEDAIQQDLTEKVEVINDTGPIDDSCTLVYRGTSYNIDDQDKVSLVTTTLHPSRYNEARFDSKGKLGFDKESFKIITSNDYKIDIPVTTVGESLKYSSYININFTSTPDMKFASYINSGSNIAITKNNSMPDTDSDNYLVELRSTPTNTSTNWVLLPFNIPLQNENNSRHRGYLDRFYIEKFVLSSNFTSLLKATSYYNEVYLPLYYPDSVSTVTNSDYLFKWDAIRLLKEGTYYFTCKYPLSIMPLDNKSYTEKLNGNMPIYYGACRFRVDVIGETYLDESTAENPVSAAYLRSYFNSIDATLNSLISGRTLYTSDNGFLEDNRTFPHRRITINLYVMDSNYYVEDMDLSSENPSGWGNSIIPCSLYEDASSSKNYFSWTLVASNNKDFTNEADSVVEKYKDVVYLSSSNLSKDLSLLRKIPLFLAANGKSSFFTANQTDKGVLDCKNPVVRLYSPIKIEWTPSNTSSLGREKLKATTKADMDSQCLIADKPYCVLFDFNALLTEYAYTNNVQYIDVSNIASVDTATVDLVSDELLEYSRSFSLVEENFPLTSTACCYTKNFNWAEKLQSKYLGVGIENTNLGFSIESVVNKKNRKTSYKWRSKGWTTLEGNPVDFTTDVYCLGDPYTKSFNDNVLYEFTSTADTVANLKFYPYDILKKNRSIDSITGKYTNSVNCANAIGVLKILNISEESLLNSLYETVYNKVKTSIESIKLKGIISKLHTLSPAIHVLNTSLVSVKAAAYNKNILLSDKLNLISYKINSRDIKHVNNLIKSVDYSLHTNNLIKNFDLNSNSWSVELRNSSNNLVSNKISWQETSNVDAEGIAKTSYETTLQGGYSITLQYHPEDTSIYKSDYEVAVNFGKKLSKNCRVEVVLIKGAANVKGYTQKLVDGSMKYEDENNRMSCSMSIPNESCSSIALIFTNSGSSSISLSISKIFVRKHLNHSHVLGWYDSFKNLNSSTNPTRFKIPSFSVVAFERSNNHFLHPITFKPKIMITNPSYTSVAYSSISVIDFIEGRVIKNISSEKSLLLPPWLRLISFVEKNSTTLRSTSEVYSLKIDNSSNPITIKKDCLSSNLYKDIAMSYDGNVITIDNITFNSRFLCNDGYIPNLEVNNEVLLDQPDDSLIQESYLPFVLQKEAFSGITNCFHPMKYIDKVDSIVTVTNIQLLDESETVLYEYEYLPIIYNETEHHLSMNLFIHQDASRG